MRITLIDISYSSWNGFRVELVDIDYGRLDSALFALNISKYFLYIDLLFFKFKIFDLTD